MQETIITKQIKIEKLQSLESVKELWDSLAVDYFQTSQFCSYLEKYNFCHQNYFILYKNNVIKTGAIVYTLPVNILTFSNRQLYIKMKVIGVAASVDSSGLIGDPAYFDTLINYIIAEENGLLLCLNYDSFFYNKKLIQLNTLPTVILKNNYKDYYSYIAKMRHHYRRRMNIANQKFKDVIESKESCAMFTDDHYHLYLNVVSKSNTKLEILSKDFFVNLPDVFRLSSYFTQENILLTWHITCCYQSKLFFLFGGINYDLRDKFEAYYNNLLEIIKEGIGKACRVINLGQTAEIPKMRVGGQLITKKMFIYHKNIIIRILLKLFQKQITYKYNFYTLNVFKNEDTIS